jgi:hypothetical protein
MKTRTAFFGRRSPNGKSSPFLYTAARTSDLGSRLGSRVFDLFLTCDQNVRHQQNFAERRLALVTLSSNRWPTLRSVAARIAIAVDSVQTGQIVSSVGARTHDRHCITSQSPRNLPRSTLRLPSRILQSAYPHAARLPISGAPTTPLSCVCRPHASSDTGSTAALRSPW